MAAHRDGFRRGHCSDSADSVQKWTGGFAGAGMLFRLNDAIMAHVKLIKINFIVDIYK
jgi:hypothetical protein